MITAVYLICIAFGDVDWSTWGIIGTGIMDVSIAQYLGNIGK